MRDIPLQNVPNQRVETTIDGVSYAIQLRTVQNLTVADVYADGKLLKGGVRCVPGQRLIPYRYLTVGGNLGVVFKAVMSPVCTALPKGTLTLRPKAAQSSNSGGRI